MLRNGGIPPVVQLQRTHRFAARKIEWEHRQEEIKLQRERERELRKEMKRQRALERERARAKVKNWNIGKELSEKRLHVNAT